MQSTTYSPSSTVTFRFTGAWDQTAQNSVPRSPLLVPSIAIAKSGGTLEFLDDLSVLRSFTYTGGTVDLSDVTVRFEGGGSATINSGSLHFGDVGGR